MVSRSECGRRSWERVLASQGRTPGFPPSSSRPQSPRRGSWWRLPPRMRVRPRCRPRSHTWPYTSCTGGTQVSETRKHHDMRTRDKDTRIEMDIKHYMDIMACLDSTIIWTYPASSVGNFTRVVSPRVAGQLIWQGLQTLRALSIDHPHLGSLFLVETLQFGLDFALWRGHKFSTCNMASCCEKYSWNATHVWKSAMVAKKISSRKSITK